MIVILGWFCKMSSLDNFVVLSSLADLKGPHIVASGEKLRLTCAV